MPVLPRFGLAKLLARLSGWVGKLRDNEAATLC